MWSGKTTDRILPFILFLHPSWLLSTLWFSLTAMLEVILASKDDCLVAGDLCSSDEACSPRLRTLRQCVAGNGSMKLGPGARSQCANAMSALLSSPLHGCQCKRGMKKEKNCLSIYWSLHQSIIHGWLLTIGPFSPSRTHLLCFSWLWSK